jgi:hypothetical protein
MHRGRQLRFYRTPNNDGRPDLPWHSVDDLQHCLGLSRDQRRYFLKAFRNGPFASSFETVATDDGLVTIAPHYVAQGFIDAAAAQMVGNTTHLYDEYSIAGMEATKKLTGGLHFSNGLLQWIAAALNRHEKVAPDA